MLIWCLIIINLYKFLIVNSDFYYYQCWKKFLLLNIFEETMIHLKETSFNNIRNINLFRFTSIKSIYSIDEYIKHCKVQRCSIPGLGCLGQLYHLSKCVSSKGQLHTVGDKPPHLVFRSCLSYRGTHLVDAMSIVVKVSWEVCIVVKARLHPPEHIYDLCSHFCLKILAHGIPLAKSQRVQRHLGSLRGSGGYFVGPTVL